MDIYLENGRGVIIKDDDEMIQALKYELESNLGQWYLGTDFGIPIFQDDGSGLLDVKLSSNAEFQNAILDVVSKRSEIVSAIVNSIAYGTATETISKTLDTFMANYNTMSNSSFMKNLTTITYESKPQRNLEIEIEIKTERGVIDLTISL
jgi:hypothetical protein